ncbi:zeta toxin family protein [Nocardioides sp. J2M5]|uniref:zeta toxin family protein n=1 Tax=Nocardioides palaemonis TaxID=2829810 RepID=UPI001BA810FE|nr:zeta toxin family protein [Nocardioides palaemonis]MBS2937078.1 zeta toxin family protein [Nocardioides palaemonis]
MSPAASSADSTPRWSTREELEDAVVAYQPHWWRTDVDALAVINDRVRHPGLRDRVVATSDLGQIVTTAAVYRPASPGAPADRPFLDERLAVHEQIIDDCVPTFPSTPASAPARTPAAYFTIGCPGSGKTSVLRRIVDLHRFQEAQKAPETQEAASVGPTQPAPCSIIDADRVRQKLPEYADGLGAFVVEEECFALTYGPVFEAALARRADVIYDTIGRLASIRDNIELLHADGFEIHVLQARAGLDDCRDRTERRALEVDGRLVPPAMLERAANDAAEALAALRREGFPLASWAIVDTSDMTSPALIEGTEPWSMVL